MSRRISQSITPTAEDIALLRGPFAAPKGGGDPLITELRKVLKDAVPPWLAKLSEDQELTGPRLDEINNAVATRRQIIEVLPDGKARNDALAALEKAGDIVAEMNTELSAITAFSPASA
ncbi:hypothetical protein [Rhodococcus sp. IEGM 1379]|uniref:hypothetical protein n=1 Tax=Rhodococcus sp. IEGM 1379 TaxID=3047086 RepID=UPI0024B73F17|nr:hypothetical protein [Rhodococcus sp. IEGM 1379]MDI9915401.1 hypothetical protein [Rhodococcus sp. IEGM 1379]